MRPPLNRTIPPIPESMSSDSIITHISEKYIEAYAKPELSTPPPVREPSFVESIEEFITSFVAKVKKIHQQNILNECLSKFRMYLQQMYE